MEMVAGQQQTTELEILTASTGSTTRGLIYCMEFIVKKFDFLQELTLIQGVVERKTTIPILANVLIRAEAGELGIVATDLEIGLKSRCPAKVTTAGVLTLPAKRLYEIIRALPVYDTTGILVAYSIWIDTGVQPF